MMESPGTKPDAGMTPRGGGRIDFDLVTIETDRLMLRPLTSDFTEIIFREFTSEITRYMFPASPTHIDETKAFITGTTALRKANKELVLAILDKNTGEFYGACGVHGNRDPKVPELGVWLKKGAHGSGYGREGVAGVHRWASENLNLNHFLYPVDRANIPSRKIAESLGGFIIQELIAKKANGGTLDEVVYQVPVAAQL